MMSIKLAGKAADSIVDGAGMRYTLFAQGCPHHCLGCQNPATHDFEGGVNVEAETILAEILENPLLRGITFSGGEPFCQAAPLAALAREVHAHGLDVWVYTGYTLETLENMHDEGIAALLGETDVLVDGDYREGERDLTLPFRGSRNQRLIDMKKTREKHALVLWEEAR